uniref:Uncharacterized protein n=1 Tax=Oryza meridionalis TaxID=40149 RepID=A0A0E0EFG0_9ORYZ
MSLPKSTTRYCSEGGGAAAELGDDEHSVAVLADAGNTAVGADCPSVHPLQLPHGVGPLNQHGLPEGVNGADLERKPRRRARRATAAACDEAREHQALVRTATREKGRAAAAVARGERGEDRGEHGGNDSKRRRHRQGDTDAGLLAVLLRYGRRRRRRRHGAALLLSRLAPASLQISERER